MPFQFSLHFFAVGWVCINYLSQAHVIFHSSTISSISLSTKMCCPPSWLLNIFFGFDVGGGGKRGLLRWTWVEAGDVDCWKGRVWWWDVSVGWGHGWWWGMWTLGVDGEWTYVGTSVLHRGGLEWFGKGGAGSNVDVGVRLCGWRTGLKWLWLAFTTATPRLFLLVFPHGEFPALPPALVFLVSSWAFVSWSSQESLRHIISFPDFLR